MKKVFEVGKRVVYSIDKEGVVWAKDVITGKERQKVATLNKGRGYYYVRTMKRNYQLHRLVAEAFIPNPEQKPEVNHRDGDKSNNAIQNLEWVTRKENTEHAMENGLLNLLNKNEGHNLKYSNKQCADVIERVNSGMTYVDAGSIYEMPYSTVAHLIRGSRRQIPKTSPTNRRLIITRKNSKS